MTWAEMNRKKTRFVKKCFTGNSPGETRLRKKRQASQAKKKKASRKR
jgi:hypothetical protein